LRISNSHLPVLSKKISNLTTTNSSTIKTTKEATVNISRIIDESSNKYWFLFLLIILIPLLLLLMFITFVCCMGRIVQLVLHSAFNLILCPCFRPLDKKSSLLGGKIFDATICYNQYDEAWLHEEFLPILSRFGRGYRIHKLDISNNLSKEKEYILRRSKRIFLIFSQPFLDYEWSNPTFLFHIRNIAIHDPFCIIVAMDIGRAQKTTNIKDLLYELVYTNTKIKTILTDNDPKEQKRCVKLNFLQQIKLRIGHMIGLNEVEYLNWSDVHFWNKLDYILPVAQYDDTKATTITDSSNPSCNNNITQSHHHHHRNNHQTDSSFSSSNDDNYSSSRFNSQKKIITNNNRNFHQNERSHFKSDNSEFKNIRDVIEKLPESMHTRLGFKHHSGSRNKSNEKDRKKEKDYRDKIVRTSSSSSYSSNSNSSVNLNLNMINNQSKTVDVPPLTIATTPSTPFNEKAKHIAPIKSAKAGNKSGRLAYND
jgi:hypothetical protein